jgi:hypothetical protein
MALVLGPILGFRGSEGGTWCTCALVITEGDTKPPELTWYVDGEGQTEERNGSERAHLKSFEDFEVWRFDWGVEQRDAEQTVVYALEDGAEYRYGVPGRGLPPRVAYASCAGFHDPEARYAREKESKNAMWKVLKGEHEKEPYHLLIMGGDQVYADQLWRTVEQLEWWARKSLGEMKTEELTEETREEISRFYFRLYLENWAEEDPAAVMCRVPTLMMWDDHDVFDGWGSKSGPLQSTAVYEDIYEKAREHFLLFQLQAANDEDLPPGMLLEPDAGGKQVNLTYAYRLGDDVAVAVLDMRSERTRERVMHSASWAALREWMRANLREYKHLLLVSTIPLVYANLRMLESALGRWPGEQDLEDDLRDQWQSHGHLDERLGLVSDLLDLAAEERCRTTILSGDVHVAALGHIEAEPDPHAPALANSMIQLISSPIVNEPLYGKVVLLMEGVLRLGILDFEGEDVDRGVRAQMLPFPNSLYQQHFIRARNWLGIEWDGRRRLHAKWYAEGHGRPFTKVVYPIGTTKTAREA